MSLEIENYDIIYKDIDNNFKNKKFDFEYFKKHKIQKKDYYKILGAYLSDKGYGYASSQINEIIEFETKEDIKIAKLLIDCNLIERLNKTLEADIYDKEIIEYRKKFGLQKDFEIKYKVNIPFEIYSVSYVNTNLISHEIDNTNKTITIEIDINPKKRVGFSEIITIYTSCGVDKVEFGVKCEEEKNLNIQIENIEKYFDMCIKNPNEAREIFKSNDFIEWLEAKDYKTQVLNYKEALSLGENIKSQDAFTLFCMLNEKYIKTANESDKDFSPAEKLPKNQENKNIDDKNQLSKIQKEYSENIENEPIKLQDKENILKVNKKTKEQENIKDNTFIENITIETKNNDKEYASENSNFEKISSEQSNTLVNETTKEYEENKPKRLFIGIKESIGKIFKRK